jgi:serine/threonine protein kinase
LIVPIDEVYANESGALTVCRFYSKGSLKDYLHQTRPNTGSYWKRYNRRSPTRKCDLNQIKTFGRQILEVLHFIYDNGLAYGHLHSGNLLFDLEQSYPIKLMDIANVITGVSSKYRGYISALKQIRVSSHRLNLCFEVFFDFRHLNIVMSMVLDEFYTNYQPAMNVRRVLVIHCRIQYRFLFNMFY